MKNFWELPLWFFDVLDFIKNSILIYLIQSFVLWNLDVTDWSEISRLIFVILLTVNAYITFKN